MSLSNTSHGFGSVWLDWVVRCVQNKRFNELILYFIMRFIVIQLRMFLIRNDSSSSDEKLTFVSNLYFYTLVNRKKTQPIQWIETTHFRMQRTTKTLMIVSIVVCCLYFPKYCVSFEMCIVPTRLMVQWKTSNKEIDYGFGFRE